MTEEERAELVAALRNPEHDRFPLRTARDAAVEIERLVKERDEARGMSLRFARRWTKAIGLNAGFQND